VVRPWLAVRIDYGRVRGAFQRVTVGAQYSREAPQVKKREAGLQSKDVPALDPEKAPRTWAEVAEFSRKLTQQDASGQTTQYGCAFAFYGWFVEQFIASSGFGSCCSFQSGYVCGYEAGCFSK